EEYNERHRSHSPPPCEVDSQTAYHDRGTRHEEPIPQDRTGRRCAGGHRGHSHMDRHNLDRDGATGAGEDDATVGVARGSTNALARNVSRPDFSAIAVADTTGCAGSG